MSGKAQKLMQEFSKAHPKLARVKLKNNSVYLAIECPTTLAMFFAFCNGSQTDTRVFLRGCTKHYHAAYPSLFRDCEGQVTADERIKRWKAYKHMLKEFRCFKGGRWRRKDLGAVLQHYGIKTPWLDVVRNLYSAIWFATHELQGSGLDGLIKPAELDYCWISFYRRGGKTGRRLPMKDLSAHHSSTHLRAHVQHGSSLAMQRDEAIDPYPCQDFSIFRIAHVRIPNTREWKLSGHIASTEFMFPQCDLDGSLKYLSTSAVQDILDEACTKFGLHTGTLGEVSSYR